MGQKRLARLNTVTIITPYANSLSLGFQSVYKNDAQSLHPSLGPTRTTSAAA